MDLFTQLMAFEETVAYRTLPPAGLPPFRHVVGSRPVLISAPHATRHTRNGNKKMEEEFTASFAHYLAKNTNSHALFNHWEIPEDPNWDQESNYKRELAQIVDDHQIEIVIDLHGMTNRHNLGVAVGTMNGRACPGYESPLRQAFVDTGFHEVKIDDLSSLQKQGWDRLIFDHPRFTGGIKSHTVTRFAVEKLEIPAMQIELCSAGRLVYRGPHDGWPFHYFGDTKGIKATMQALETFVGSIV
jgi:hypothetical protein